MADAAVEEETKAMKLLGGAGSSAAFGLCPLPGRDPRRGGDAHGVFGPSPESRCELAPPCSATRTRHSLVNTQLSYPVDLQTLPTPLATASLSAGVRLGPRLHMGSHGRPLLLSLLHLAAMVAVAALGPEFNFTAGPRVSVPQRELKGVLVWTDPSVEGNASAAGGSSQLLELEGLLLLGGRDAIHVLDASNVSRPVAPPIVWAPSLSEKSECSSKGPMMEVRLMVWVMECANYIRVLHRLNDSHLFTCGTHAFNPQCAYIRTTPRPLQLLPAMEAGRGRCPYSRSQGAASVVLDGEIYTATSNNFLSTEYVVARSLGGRTPLKTELLNDWLSHPDFVFLGAVRESEDSEDGDDDKVYIFFSERDRDTRAMVASVARVCKGDLGGLKALQKRWSSFLKARVECTLPGSLGPLQKIRSVFYHQAGPSWRDGLFYGVFESQGPWGSISALCPLPVSRLRDVFQGPYREFHSDSMCWSARSTNIPSPRPGSCITNAMRARGIKNSTDLPEQTLTFALEHPLMAQAVTPGGAAGPVLVAPPGLRYTQVALLRVLDANGAPRDLVYLGTDSGLLHKALLGPPGQPAHVIEELHLFSDPQPISSLQISHDKTRLFVGSGRAVAQVALGGASCGRYPSCADCVLARDPTCAWDAKLGCATAPLGDARRFVSRHRQHRKAERERASHVPNQPSPPYAATPTVTPVLAALGGSAFLPCPMPSAHAHARWLHEGRQLRRPPPSEAPAWRALPDGLLLLALGRERSGAYECSALERRSHRAVAAFSLTPGPRDWRAGLDMEALSLWVALPVGSLLLLLLLLLLLRWQRRARGPELDDAAQVPPLAAATRPRAAANEERAPGEPRRVRNLRHRRDAQRLAQQQQLMHRDEEGGAEWEGDSGDSEEEEVGGGKMGAKKQRKLQMKQEKKSQREAEEADREERRRMEAARDEQRKKEEARERDSEERQAVEELRAKEEEERREQEEYLKLRAAFVVEEEGMLDEATEQESQNQLQEFIDFIKASKVVLMEDLASHFAMRTQDAVSRVQDLMADGNLSGVLDDRGKFIYVTEEEMGLCGALHPAAWPRVARRAGVCQQHAGFAPAQREPAAGPGNRKSLTMSLAPDPSDANATAATAAAVVSSDLRASGPTLPASLSTPDDPTEASLAPTDQLESLELLERFKPLVVLLYALLVTAAIVGNVLLVGAIARVKRMRTVTNFLIGNLAASDALMCALCVPTSLAYVYDPRGWVLGRGTCLASLYLQPVTVHVSSFTLVAIALDRYSALVHPLRPRMSPRRCGLLAAALWLLGAALAAPALANTRYVRLPADDGGGEAEVTLCEELWGARRERERVAHAAALVALTYALPLAVAVAAYARLGAKLRARVVPGSVTRAQAERDRRRRRKTQGLLAAVVAAFALCWLPLHAFNLARDVDLSLVAPRYFGAVQLACHWVAMSSACANPLIYAWLHGAFRAELRRLFCCCCRRGGAAKAKAQSSTASLASVAL
ncbi:unnamed protein product [Lampetra planeri]